MIGVPEAHRHFDSTIGGEVLDVLHTLGVSPENIGYFTLDNAENNDTAMEVIGAKLGFDGRLRRGRCFGHTINLSAKALLFGKNADAFEQQLSGAEALSDTEYARWRKRGPVGKLHNIVVDVRISHRLIYLFKEVQRDEINRATTLKLRSKKPLKLIIDNDTRWLSQLYMIHRALRLKTSIELLLIRYKAQWEDKNRSKKTGQVTQAKLAKKPRILRDENQLTDKDWEVLYYLEAILTVFETVVKTLEGDGHIRRRKQGWTGSYGNIWDVVLGYELLLNTLEEYKRLAADFPDPEHFRIGINLAWGKLDEYYQRLDDTPIYYTAMALHPAYRWDWFDETWAHKPSWVEKAKEMVADVWLSDYAHLEVRTSSSRGDDEPPAKRPRFFNPFEKNSRVPSSIPPYAAAIVGDEYQAWQTDRDASDGNVRDPIGYWITKQGRYPRLSRMALDFLTIQPMSAECERLFSAAGKMVSGLRTNLDAEIIAICQVLRSWYRAGLIKDLDPLLKSHLESKLDGGCGTLSDDELALAESKWLLEGEGSASEVDDSTQQQQAEEGKIPDADGPTAQLHALAFITDSYFILTAARVHRLWRFAFDPEDVASLPEEVRSYVQNVCESEGLGSSVDEWAERPRIAMLTSLDHSIYFHEPLKINANDWMLAEQESPWAANGRALVVQRIFAKDGTLLATCSQEGIMRIKPGSKQRQL
ncbi:Acyl-coenzyme A thioesterase 8 [Fusarium oxysporum f. sp. rapae]|uniref:Acyl-coenzyme A thioesterase 8 n=1 Tax=Fusarium oxysporum f. sp. rapae TaxID=485398 RepID=A0A8J5NI95_FUSOX|nr:Acyl-coenzyme A thioesterase 8 [Fusarium oxysporum f. sp. rapae]